MNTSIAFIGGGNMASSLIGGMIAATFKAEQILVSEPDAETRKSLQQRFGIQTTNNNLEALGSDIVILATKPQQLQSVCRQLAPLMEEHAMGKQDANHGPLFISIAAGIRSDDIDRWLGGTRAIIRCMPNTPSLFQSGATALYSNEKVTETQKNLAESIMSSAGIALWVKNESNLDAVTALSGSGPAYFFLLMEAMIIAGRELGLDDNVAEKLTIQTALGAARMADGSKEDVTTLRERVTSKGGTTESAIKYFENSNFHQLVKKAMQEAHDRSITLADELARDD
jgi:pyrroline-5-carboxylate reductase